MSDPSGKATDQPSPEELGQGAIDFQRYPFWKQVALMSTALLYWGLTRYMLPLALVAALIWVVRHVA